MTKRRRFLLGIALVFGALALGIKVAAPTLRRHAESMKCGNYIVAVGCVARLWTQDHSGRLPADLRSLSDEQLSPEFLICPGDHTRTAAADWRSFTPAHSSYEIVTPDLRDGDANGIFIRCKIHGHLGYADATVFDGTRRRTKSP